MADESVLQGASGNPIATDVVGGLNYQRVKVDIGADGTNNPWTGAISGTVSAISAGDLASGAVDSGNPVKIGGVARQTNPTAVSTGGRVNAIFDKLGKQVVVGSVRDLKGNQLTTITTTTPTTIVPAGGTLVFNDLYGLVISNTSATATTITIKDSSGGTDRFILIAPAGELRGFMLPESAAHKQSGSNAVWTATCSAGVSSIHITSFFVANT